MIAGWHDDHKWTSIFALRSADTRWSDYLEEPIFVLGNRQVKTGLDSGQRTGNPRPRRSPASSHARDAVGR